MARAKTGTKGGGPGTTKKVKPTAAPKAPKPPSPEKVCRTALAVKSKHAAANDDPDTPPAGKGCTFKCYEPFTKNRHGSYKYNGYQWILKNKKSTYDIDFKTDPAAKARISLALETDFGFSNKPANVKMFRPAVARDDPSTTGDWSLAGTTQRLPKGLKNYRDASYVPFNHQYHHIMPWESLYGAFDGATDTTQLLAIQSSGYNLNRGINVIILPMTEAYSWAMQLPTHFKGHIKYSRSLTAMLNEVKGVLLPTATGPHPIHAGNVASLKTCLENWEKAQFDKIVAQGTTQPTGHVAPDIDDCDLDDMMNGKATVSKGRTPT